MDEVARAVSREKLVPPLVHFLVPPLVSALVPKSAVAKSASGAIERYIISSATFAMRMEEVRGADFAV